MITAMRPHWRRRRSSRGVSPIIGTILILAMTVVVFTILFSFRFNTPPSPPNVNFIIKTGGSNPVWGDPTDEQAGSYALMNTSAIIVSAASPTNLALDQIEFTFVCNNESTGGNETILVQGDLQDMSWNPGISGNPPPGAPVLGWCASFHAGGYGGGSFGTFYNRLGMFIPISDVNTTLQAGDTFLLYIHNGGYPLDYNDGPGDCVGTTRVGCLDGDDYHGAPPWCFTNPGACTIYLTYTGSPTTQLAEIPVYSMAPPTS
jgi:flagellin-like protein